MRHNESGMILTTPLVFHLRYILTNIPELRNAGAHLLVQMHMRSGQTQ